MFPEAAEVKLNFKNVRLLQTTTKHQVFQIWPALAGYKELSMGF